MRITHLLLLISIAVFTTGCNSSPAKSKGKLISDCMSDGGTPEECDRKYN